MAFYKFGSLDIYDAGEIVAKFGLSKSDLYDMFLYTANGGRFEFEDEHPIYVERLNANIWIDVLYGDTDNYRSNLFYWNAKYKHQIPENAIIIGDTQNNGFIVYVHSGLEKGMYYWDDSYAFECSNESCNAYFIANDIKSLFENLKVNAKEYFTNKKRCKPNREYGIDNMIYRASDSEEVITIDAAKCKKLTHKCKKFEIKYEFTKQCYTEELTRQGIEKIEQDSGYVFSDNIKKFIFDGTIENIKRKDYHIYDGTVYRNLRVLYFYLDSWEASDAWEINCSGDYLKLAIEKGDYQRAEALRELNKNYMIFAYDFKDAYAIDKRNGSIVKVLNEDLRIQKIAQDFDSFIKYEVIIEK